MKKILQGKIVKRVCLLFVIGFVSIMSYATKVTIVATFAVFTPDTVTITEGDTVCFTGIGAIHPLIMAIDTLIVF
ncbi:MAG: hypothetical protein IIA88_05025, partial [Bacteroidetes bacterium]|nr:hypothetical protein [Bacteroidota bacterium]